ncbi:dTDP-4-dehydrorhamnose reductase [Raoultella sp. T31]|nr:dTDP-4-dehydrorhamnose reductase [Raoultella sp. T31]
MDNCLQAKASATPHKSTVGENRAPKKNYRIIFDIYQLRAPAFLLLSAPFFIGLSTGRVQPSR